MNSKRNIAVLFVCQALYWGAVIVGITLSAIVGASLAPEPILATLPAGLLALGAIVATAPASLLMQRYGSAGQLPFTIVFDRAGVLRHRKTGELQAAELSDWLTRLL